MFPILLQFGPVTIQTLWLTMSIGFIFSLVLFLKRVQLKRLSLDLVFRNQISLIIASLLGARLTFIIFNHYFYFPFTSWTDSFRLLAVWDHGLSFWGGFFTFAIIFGLILYFRDRENLKIWLDASIVPFLSLMIFSHLGDFFDGKNYGHETNLPWGITFDSINVKYTVAIHPTQFYAAIYSLGIILFLKHYQSRLDILKQNGLPGLTGIFLYSGLNFLNEFLKGDDAVEIIGIRLEQLLAFIICLLVAWQLKKEYKNYQIEKVKPPAPAPTAPSETDVDQPASSLHP